MLEISLSEMLAFFFSFFFGPEVFHLSFLYTIMPVVVTTGADLQELVTKAKTCLIMILVQ